MLSIDKTTLQLGVPYGIKTNSTIIASGSFSAGSLNATGNSRISGELIVEGNKLVITGISPTLYLRDTNERTGMIHMNGGLMYFLSGVVNSDTWV